MQGMEAYGVRAFAEALEVIPSTLAENAGLDPISIVTQLRNKHAQGDSAAGINVRKVCLLPIDACNRPMSNKPEGPCLCPGQTDLGGPCSAHVRPGLSNI